jgi:DNA-binding transcriptional regulator PaaX
MNNGFVFLHRKMKEWEWYTDSNVKDVFIHLLLSANHEEASWHGIKIGRGQVVTGRFQLGKETGISQQSLRTALKKLKSTGEITIKSTNKYSLVTLVKWSEYQGSSTNKVTSKLTNDQPTTNQQLTTNNKDNKKDKENKINKGETLVPLLKEVKYLKREQITDCVIEELAQKYEVPVEFARDCWDTAKNWLDSKALTKTDYKAFLSNWIKRDKADRLYKARNLQKGGRYGVADFSNVR